MRGEAAAAIDELLARTIGLETSSIGERAIDAAVRARMSANGTAVAAEYLTLLRTRPAEVTALVEEIVVPETWFFRDRLPFSNLAARARARRGEAFRVLSAPCSTGEEPYSIAMALLDAGFAADDFAIDAVDVSARALAVAAAGVYGAISFRGDELGYRDRWFRPVGAGWELSAEVRAAVKFERGNLLEQGSTPAGRRYHAIFCRNLLIYLTQAARGQIIARLESRLEPGGILVVGHAEALQVMDPRFRAVDPPGSFSYARVSEGRAPRSSSVPAAGPRQETRKLHSFPPARPRVDPPAPPRDLLAEAAALADRGELAAAAELCQRHVEQAGPDARSYALLGAIRQADGALEDAEAMFSRALYCDPGHYESLVHLALLRERRGDRAGAENLRRRAGKARPRGDR